MGLMFPQTAAVLLTGLASVIHRGVIFWKCFCCRNRDKTFPQLQREQGARRGCLALAFLARSLLWPSSPPCVRCSCSNCWSEVLQLELRVRPSAWPALVCSLLPAPSALVPEQRQGAASEGKGSGRRLFFSPCHFPGRETALQRTKLPPAADLGLCPVAGLPGLGEGSASSRSRGRERRWRRSRDGVMRSSVSC